MLEGAQIRVIYTFSMSKCVINSVVRSDLLSFQLDTSLRSSPSEHPSYFSGIFTTFYRLLTILLASEYYVCYILPALLVASECSPYCILPFSTQAAFRPILT